MRTLPRHPERGTVLLITVFLAAITMAVTYSLTGAVQDRLGSELDSKDSLKAELAVESGVEYTRRRLLLDPQWPGTDAAGVDLGDGSKFFVTVSQQGGQGGGTHLVDVQGTYGDGFAHVSGDLAVHPGSSENADGFAFIFLGDDCHVTHGMMYGDVLVTDRAWVVDDWLFDEDGRGYYAESHGPDEDGIVRFVCTGVDGTLYKYRDDLDDYQWLGPEEVLTENSRMPSWDLEEFLQPGPGKVIMQNPYTDTTRWVVKWASYEETVVFVLNEGQRLDLWGCDFPGGVVVYCPKSWDPRQGPRNVVFLKKGTCIGGGTGGAYPNIGLVAPGAMVRNDCNGNWLYGFHLVQSLGRFRYSSILGQMVVLDYVQNLKDCELEYVPDVGENLPPLVEFGSSTGWTDLLTLRKDYD